jgi:hypothetical protein
MGFDCQSQPKGCFMLPNQEEKDLEKKIRRLRVDEVMDSQRLKAILRGGLVAFEELLKELPKTDREVALSLYLQDMRDVSFRFHLAVAKMIIKNRQPQFGNREAMLACLKKSQKDLENVARLYQML